MKTETFFRRIEKNPRPVVVDVWAPWCGPCRRMNPIFEELKEAYAGRVDVIKVNADESQPLVKQLGVLGIPTAIAYRNGEEIGRRTGAMSRSDLQRMFEATLSEGPIKIPAMSRKTRLVRLFIALALLGMGLTLEPGWPFFILTAIVLLMAVYDLIPGVTAFRDKMIQKLLRAAAEADVTTGE